MNCLRTVDKPASDMGESGMAVRECDECGDLVYPLDASDCCTSRTGVAVHADCCECDDEDDDL